MHLVTTQYLPAKRLLFCSDLHLDWRPTEQFLATLQPHDYDLLLIAGDIGLGKDVHEKLAEILAGIGKPIVSVLGNHDFYGSSFEKVNERMLKRFPLGNGWMIRLDGSQVLQLSSSAALIGVDGWGDGIAGYGLSSSAVMQDWIDIRELRKARREEKLFAYLRHLGCRSAQQLESALTLTLKNFEQVLVLTHVPPFPEACLFAADHDRDNLLPFYCNTALGHLLRQAADHHPCQQITVLCGHTHHSAGCDIVPNLRVLVAAAEYGHPQPSRLLKI